MASKTMSRCAAETEQGTHVFEISGYSLHRGLGVGRFLRSATFAIGGYDWSVLFYPDGADDDCKDYVSVFVHLMSKNTMARASMRFSLVHQINGTSPPYCRRGDPVLFNSCHPTRNIYYGIRKLKKRSELEASAGYHIGDSLVIECVLTVIKEPRVAEPRPSGEVEVPPSDISEHLAKLLEAKEGTDVTFEVEGEEFPAHKLVLGMRSPVFKAELYGQMREKNMSRIVIRDMQPAVFKALLHFMYTDSLPAMDDLDEDSTKEMITHLLVVADRYAMERLKLMCESVLSNRLDVETVATTLALADQHSCSTLKNACVGFITSSGRIDDVIASQGYVQLKRTCPLALVEMWERTSRLRKT